MAIIKTRFTIQKHINPKDIKITLRYPKLSPDIGRESVSELIKDHNIHLESLKKGIENVPIPSGYNSNSFS